VITEHRFPSHIISKKWDARSVVSNLAKDVGTLAANLAGGYLVGIAIAFFSHHPQLTPEWRLFVVTGFLGGLTTFSSFSGESVALLQRGDYGWALAHTLIRRAHIRVDVFVNRLPARARAPLHILALSLLTGLVLRKPLGVDF